MQNNIQFIEIRANYSNQLAKYRDDENTLFGKILTKERQLQRLETKRKELSRTMPRWTELLLRPLIEHLKLALPEWICDAKTFIPMGISSSVTVFFIKNGGQAYEDKYADDNSIYISFLPGDLTKGELLYQTGESTSANNSGTTGEINQLNKVSKPVESIEEIIKFLTKQIKANGTH